MPLTFRAAQADKVATARLAEIEARDARGWTSTERQRATAVFAAACRNSSTREWRSGMAIVNAALNRKDNSHGSH